jgi:hypothetical protein
VPVNAYGCHSMNKTKADPGRELKTKLEMIKMETVEQNLSSVGQQETDQLCKGILNAFKESEYLNIADFRLLGADSQTLTTAMDYLLANEYIVALDADEFDDLDAGNAEVVYARVTPIGNHET